jgi:hypothetical protein
MNTHRVRSSTFEEILTDLAASGRPVTVQAALMVIVDEMNHYLGTDIKAIPRPMPEQTDAERRRDIEELLTLGNKAGGWLAEQLYRNREP